MSSNGIAERRAVLNRLKMFEGGRATEGVPDDKALAFDVDTGEILRYIVFRPGTMVPSYSDRSIEGEEAQPQILPFVVEVWGPDATGCADSAGLIGENLRGWAPTENSTQIRIRGGGDYKNKDSAGKPVRFMQAVNGEMTINMTHEFED